MTELEWSSAEVARVLGPEGPFGRKLSGYEARHGQLGMAEAVDQALRQDQVLICEAGTGIGKTLAYLVPAILSGKKVVISTATRALQEQIWQRDLPLVERVLGVNARAALMKGLGNYLCLRRYGEYRAKADLEPGRSRVLQVLADFVAESTEGDLGELSGLSEHEPALAEVAASSDTRVGSACPHYEACFVTRMRANAQAARLVIVNHHLFFADLALRGPHPGKVIPDYDAVIFDEAHQLEDVVTQFFGARVSRSGVERLSHELERLIRIGITSHQLANTAQSGPIAELRAASDGFWSQLRGSAASHEPRTTLERDAWHGRLQEHYFRLDSALEGLGWLAQDLKRQLPPPSGPSRSGARTSLGEGLDVVGQRAQRLRDDLSAIVDTQPGRVAWLDVGDRNVALSASPVDVSDLLRERLFETTPCVVLTSATLATSGGGSTVTGPFGFLKKRLGLESLEEGRVVDRLFESPFDFRAQALLYTPKDLPLPAEPSFGAAAAERTRELIEITGGGAFVLTTSLRSMRDLHSRLAELLPGRRLLLQGEAPKTTLIDAFRTAGDAVLVATMGFWEGVDVPGRALRLVVLEKIPFVVPSDPIIKARANALEAEGRSAFSDLYLPLAALTLKQGFGRLIRTGSDSGIVALLDQRLHRRGYGKRLLDGLPHARRTTDIETVRSFFGALEARRLGS